MEFSRSLSGFLSSFKSFKSMKGEQLKITQNGCTEERIRIKFEKFRILAEITVGFSSLTEVALCVS